MMKKKLICLDIQTTGLSLDDEILQISIIDENYNVLFNRYMKPMALTSWEDAEAVHHITPEMVQNEKAIAVYKEEIQAILDGADIVLGYNIKYFDSAYLSKCGLDMNHLKTIDMIEMFACAYGEWNDYFEEYIWQSLSTCCKYYGYESPKDKRDGLENAKATLFCYKEMCKRNRAQE